MSLLFIVVPIVALVLLAFFFIKLQSTSIKKEYWKHYAVNVITITVLVIVSIVEVVAPVRSGWLVYGGVNLSALQLHHEPFRRLEILLLLTVLSAATLLAVLATLKPLPPFLQVSLFISYSVLFNLRVVYQSKHKQPGIRSNPCLPLSDTTTVQGNCRGAVRTPISIHITTTAASTSTLHLGETAAATSIPPLLPSPFLNNHYFPEDTKRKQDSSKTRDLERQPRNPKSSPRRRRQARACNIIPNLLIFTLVSQSFIFAAYICDIISSVSHTSTTPNLTLLEILHTACTVVSTTVIMSALFLKTYKTHLSFSSDSSIGSEPPLSPATSSSSYHSESEDALHIPNHGPTSSSHRQSIQVVEPNSRAPVIIQLAPPPPPKAKKSLPDLHSTHKQPRASLDFELNTLRLNRAEIELQMIGGDSDVYDEAEILSISGVMLDKGRPRQVEKPLPLIIGDKHVYASSEAPRCARAPAVFVPPPAPPSRQNSLPYQHQSVWPGRDMRLPTDAPSKARKIFGFGSGVDDREIQKSETGVGKRHTIGGAFAKLRKAKKHADTLKSAPADTVSFNGPLPPLPPMYVNHPPLPPPAFVAPVTAPIPIPATNSRRPSYPRYDDDHLSCPHGDNIGGSADSGYAGMGNGMNEYRYQGVAGVSPRFTPPGSRLPEASRSNSTSASGNASPRTPGGSRRVPQLKRSFGSKGRTLSPGLMFELANEGYSVEGNDASTRTTAESEEGQFEDAVEDFESESVESRRIDSGEFRMADSMQEEGHETRSDAAVDKSVSRQRVLRIFTNNGALDSNPSSPSTSMFTARPTHSRHRSTGASTMATVPLSPISLDITGFPMEDVNMKSPTTCSTITAKPLPQSSISSLAPLASTTLPQAMISTLPVPSFPPPNDEWEPHPFAATTKNLRRSKSSALSDRSGTLSSISLGSSIGSSGAHYAEPVPYLAPALRDSGVMMRGHPDREFGDEVLTLEETMGGSNEVGRWEDEREGKWEGDSNGVGRLERRVEGELRCVTPTKIVRTPVPNLTPERVKEKQKERKEKKEKKGEGRKMVEKKKSMIVFPIKERAIDLHLKQVEVEERMRVEAEEAKIRMRRGVHEKQQLQYGPISSSLTSTNWAARSSAGSDCASIAPSAHSSSSNAYKFPMFFPHAYASGALDEKAGKRPHTPTLSAFSSPPPAWKSGSQPVASTSSLRFSAGLTMGSVKSAFAGVGAKMTGAMSRNSQRASSGLGQHLTTFDREKEGDVIGGFGGYEPRRNSSARTTQSSIFGSVVIEGTDDEGDFMDLRDPFACPVGNVTVGGSARVASMIRESGEGFVAIVDSAGGVSSKSRDGTKEGGTGSGVSATRPARRMSAWGKLPMPMLLPIPPPLPTSSSAGSASSSSTGSTVNAPGPSTYPPTGLGRRPTMTEKTRIRKQRRAKKVSSVRGASAAFAASVADASVVKAGLPPSQRSNTSTTSYSSSTSSAGRSVGVGRSGGVGEDADFDFEEALLAQRLLTRLDSQGWDSRSELGC